MVQFIRHGRITEPRYPSDLDFVVVTNEDLGFTSDLTIATLNHLNTTLPYPQEWDQDSEVCVLHKALGFLDSVGVPRDDNDGGCMTNMSYLDRNPAAATYSGVGADTEDEYHKSLFTSHMYAGVSRFHPSATASLQAHMDMDYLRGWSYIPEMPLSMFFPIYLDIYGSQATYVVTTQDETTTNFSRQEEFEIRYFYNIRRMNKAESDLMNSLSGVPVRWAQLGS